MPKPIRDEPTETTRIASLTALTRELSQAREPGETLRAIRRAMAEIYGPTTLLMLSTRGLGEGEYRLVQIYLDGLSSPEEIDPWPQTGGPVHRGGPVAEMVKAREPQVFRGVNWSGDPYFHAVLAGYDSAAAVPFHGEHVPMDWIILLKRSPGAFTPTDLEQVVLRTALAGSLLESQTLTQEVARAHASIDGEVRRVGQIQRSLLPHPLPQIPGLEIAASYETFGEAGGDLYDFVPLGGVASRRERWAIFIGDASGHGPSAAVVIAIVQALLLAHAPGAADPGALLELLNRHLCRRPIESSFVTAFLGFYEPSSRRFAYACAGHPPPILVRGSAPSATWLDAAGGLPLGVHADYRYEEAGIDLEMGDALVLYTDGIQEARDEGGAMFGMEGIEAAVRRCSCAPERLVPAIRQEVAAHARGRKPTDDQTLVALRVV